MPLLNWLSNFLGDLVIGPFRPWPLALFVSSSAMALILIALFRVCASPISIRRARNQLVARIMELLLFGHDGRTLILASMAILKANVAYLGRFISPILITALPVSLLLVQGAAWFERRPYRVGEPIILELTLAPDQSAVTTPVTVTTAPDLQLVAGPVRILRRRELCYRLAALNDCEGWVDVEINGDVTRKIIIVGDQFARLATDRLSRTAWESLFYPGEQVIAAGCPVERIRTSYPKRTFYWGTREYSVGVLAIVIVLCMSLLYGRICGVDLV